MSGLSMPGLFSGRYFKCAEDAAKQYQYEAALRAANARDVKRYGVMQCAYAQRLAAESYAAARAAMGVEA